MTLLCWVIEAASEKRELLNASDVCRILPIIVHGRTRVQDGVHAILMDVVDPCRKVYVAAYSRASV